MHVQFVTAPNVLQVQSFLRNVYTMNMNMMIIHWTKKSAEVLSFDLFYFMVVDFFFFWLLMVVDLIEYKINVFNHTLIL
jgi:hypothetical protein